MNTYYHYTECGLENIFLTNGFNFKTSSRGQLVSINDVEGLHKAIGLYLVNNKKDLSHADLKFLRHEMLVSQLTLGNLLGVSEQAIRRWESGKITIPKPPETLIRLLYKDHVHSANREISKMLNKIANLENNLQETQVVFKDTLKGWKTAA